MGSPYKNVTPLPISLSPERSVYWKKLAAVRKTTLDLTQPLELEDMAIQSMPDVSPPKWHLAHTSWFFETFILKPYQKGYREFQKGFDFLFNSYYKTVGSHLPRKDRGALSRPSLQDILNYREYIEEKLRFFISTCGSEIWREAAPLWTLGIHHEEQHQELLLMDVQHILYTNPERPNYLKDKTNHPSGETSPLQWFSYPGGLREIGFEGAEFCFDNETPRHRIYVEPYRLASRLVTCGEYLAFMEDKGYERPKLWLSDGWDWVESSLSKAPLYWEKKDRIWYRFTLAGTEKIHPNRPVSHISYYEADAFARWQGKRLPTEAEWELAAVQVKIEGNFLETGELQTVAAPHPCPSPPKGGEGDTVDCPQQLFGDVWEWTASPYVPYPRFRPTPGALGEYNGKFMCNQMVLRGGSCFTPTDHIRATYRNFYPPHCQWQMGGIRLAEEF